MTVKKVLLIEDDFDVREALVDLLVDDGYDVTAAADGQAGLALLQAGLVPELIILDLMMPVMNGFDFRAAQRADPALARIPVIVLTADRGAQARATELDADFIVAKPVRIDDLLAVIRRCERRAVPS